MAVQMQRQAWSSPLPQFGIACALLIALGDAWRAQTLHISDYVSFTLGHLAYSDVIALYSAHDLASHHLPYLQTDIEYPAVTGLVMWVTALLPGVQAYFIANSLFLLCCALGTMALLSRLVPAKRLWRFALAPMLWSYGVLNWDLLSVLELVAAVYFVQRDRFGWAGVMLALGTWTKLYPGFALPVVLVYSFRLVLRAGGRDRFRDLRALLNHDSPPLRLLGSFMAVTLLLNLPIALLNYHGWSYFLVMQANRGINPDSIWFHMPGIHVRLVNLWFPTLFAFGLCWLALRTWWGDRWDVGVLLSILLFLLFTKDYSPQYDLWVLPLLALLMCPVWLWVVYCVADFAYYAAIFFWLYLNQGYHFPFSLPQPDLLLGGAVWGREVALALVFVWSLTQFVGRASAYSASPIGRRDEASDSLSISAQCSVVQAPAR